MEYDEQKATNLWRALGAQFETGGVMVIVPDVKEKTVEECLKGGIVAMAWDRPEIMVRYGFQKLSEDWWRADIDIKYKTADITEHVSDTLVTNALVKTLVEYLHKISTDPQGIKILKFTAQSPDDIVWDG